MSEKPHTAPPRALSSWNENCSSSKKTFMLPLSDGHYHVNTLFFDLGASPPIFNGQTTSIHQQTRLPHGPVSLVLALRYRFYLVFECLIGQIDESSVVLPTEPFGYVESVRDRTGPAI